MITRYTPNGRNPDYGTGELNGVHLFDAGTEVITTRGGGFIKSIKVGVSPGVGGFVKFYDTGSAAAIAPTNLIVGIDTANIPNGDVFDINYTFSNGLVVVVNGAGSSLEVSGRWGRTTRTILRSHPRVAV